MLFLCSILILVCIDAYAQPTSVDPFTSSRVRISHKINAPVDIVSEVEILDRSMVPIGATDARHGYGIWRDPEKLYRGIPSYHFWMKDNKHKRVELQALYVTQNDIDDAGLSAKEIQDHQLALSLYHFGKGEAPKGERWVYEYGLYLPSSIGPTSSGIIAQWHGMPDRTTLKHSDGKVTEYSLSEFVTQIMSSMYFKGAVAYSKTNSRPNGIIRDYGGNPPIALKVGDGCLYLVCRVDRSRVTVPNEKIHMRPPLVESKKSPEGNKTIFGVWEEHLSNLPKNQWLNMKFEIYWPLLKEDNLGPCENGNIKFYMNGKLQADWTGPLGNNDKHGTYFKYGIYVPGPEGLEIWQAGLHQYRIVHRNLAGK